MKCINCGNDLMVTWKYCRKCGCPVASTTQQNVLRPKKHGKGIVVGLFAGVLLCAVLFLITATSLGKRTSTTVNREPIRANTVSSYSEQIEKKTHRIISKHTQRIYMSDRLVSNYVIVFDERGLLKNGYVDDTFASFSYQFDDKGNPEQVQISPENSDGGTIDLKNIYNGQKLVEAQITGIFEGEESTYVLLELLENYRGYANVTLRVENTDAQIRLSDGQIVYSYHSDDDDKFFEEVSHIYQEDGGKRETTKQTWANGTTKTETKIYDTNGQLAGIMREQTDSKKNRRYQTYQISYNPVLSSDNGKTMIQGYVANADYSDEDARSEDKFPSYYSIIYTYGEQGILESCEIAFDAIAYAEKTDYDIYGNAVHMETRSGDYLKVDEYQYY